MHSVPKSFSKVCAQTVLLLGRGLLTLLRCGTTATHWPHRVVEHVGSLRFYLSMDLEEMEVGYLSLNLDNRQLISLLLENQIGKMKPSSGLCN